MMNLPWGGRIIAGLALPVGLACLLTGCRENERRVAAPPAPAAQHASPSAPGFYSAEPALLLLPPAGVPAIPNWTLVPRDEGSIPLSTVALKGAPTVNQEPLAELGYVEEEYFLSGRANLYAAAGKGISRPAVPYTTRILVRRPADPARFSGTIVMEPSRDLNEWTTVILAAWPYFVRHGDIYVAWSMSAGNVPALLKKYDPARYAPIDIPDEGLRWDIMAQTAWLLRSPDGPLGKLGFIEHAGRVKGGLELYSTGASLTASMQASFINNGHHAHARRPDGGPVIDGYVPVVSAGKIEPPNDATVIRILSESEYQSPGTPDRPGAWTARLPDNDRPGAAYREYDLAGTSHAGWIDQSQFTISFYQLGPQAIAQFTPDCAHPPSDLPSKVDFIRAAFGNLEQWEREGMPLPPNRLFDLGDDHMPKRDTIGRIEGGVRPYWIEVPKTLFHIDNRPARPAGPAVTAGVCGQLGYETTVVDQDQNYLPRVREQLALLLKERYLLQEEAHEEYDRARWGGLWERRRTNLTRLGN